MNKTSNRKLAIWLFMTAVGIWLIFIGTEKFSPYIWSITGVTSDWIFIAPGFIGGVILGVLQWRLLHNLLKGAYAWIFITPLSLSISLFVGLRAVLVGHASIEAVWIIATPAMVIITVLTLVILYSYTSRTEASSQN